MKVKTKTLTKNTVILRLTEEEAQLLGALADFPLWSEQPENIHQFLEELSEKLGWRSAKDTGYVGSAADKRF